MLEKKNSLSRRLPSGGGVVSPVSFSLVFVLLSSITTHQQTTISVRFAAPPAGGTSYVLQWKEHPATWDGAASTPVAAGVTEADATPLQPGATYCVRLVPISPDGTQGTPGPELVVDTEAIGCTPQQKSCCTVL